MPNMIKILVAGGRDFTDYPFMEATLNAIVKQITEQGDTPLFFHGDYGSADMCCQLYCNRNNHRFRRFSPDWDKHGLKAGPIRNTKMLMEGPDIGQIFWDGTSPGTNDMRKKLEKSLVPTSKYTYRNFSFDELIACAKAAGFDDSRLDEPDWNRTALVSTLCRWLREKRGYPTDLGAVKLKGWSLKYQALVYLKIMLAEKTTA